MIGQNLKNRCRNPYLKTTAVQGGIKDKINAFAPRIPGCEKKKASSNFIFGAITETVQPPTISGEKMTIPGAQ